MLRAGTSPALERYREEKAKLAMLDRLERERKLLPLDDIEKMLIPFCDTLRNMAERLGRYYGVEALKMYLEAVEESEVDPNYWTTGERFLDRRDRSL